MMPQLLQLLLVLVSALLTGAGVLRGRMRNAVAGTWLLGAAEVAAAVAVSALAYGWLRVVNAGTPSGNVIFVTVVDCLLFGQCYTIGPGSSVLLNNGAVWPALEVAVRHYGGTADTAHTVVVGMFAAGVGVILLTASRFARPAVAGAAAVAALGLLSSHTLAVPLLDTSVTFLFCATGSMLLLVYALTSRPGALVVGTALAAHGLAAHASGVSILPAFVFIAAAGARSSPLRAVGIAVASYVVATAATSWQTLGGNFWAIRGVGLLPVAVVGIGLLVAVGRALNPRFRAMAPELRSLIVFAALTGPYALGMVYLRIIHHAFLPGYLPPVVAPMALASVLVAAWPVRRFVPPERRPWVEFIVSMAVALAALSYWHPPEPQPRAPRGWSARESVLVEVRT